MRIYGDAISFFQAYECVWFCTYVLENVTSKSLLAPNYNNYTFICVVVFALSIAMCRKSTKQQHKLSVFTYILYTLKMTWYLRFDRNLMRWTEYVNFNYCDSKTKQPKWSQYADNNLNTQVKKAYRFVRVFQIVSRAFFLKSRANNMCKYTRIQNYNRCVVLIIVFFFGLQL